jgi:hypothetical protein
MRALAAVRFTENDTGHNRGKARTSPAAIPLLVKNFKRDALGQPF